MDKEYIIKKILNRLQTALGPIYDDFIDMMKNQNIVISGSFILQCIYNEKWKNSDIDLFVYNDHNISDCCGINHYPLSNSEGMIVKSKVFIYENDDVKFTIYYHNNDISNYDGEDTTIINAKDCIIFDKKTNKASGS